MIGLLQRTRSCTCSSNASFQLRQFSKKKFRGNFTAKPKSKKPNKKNAQMHARPQSAMSKEAMSKIPRPPKASLQTGIIPPALLLPTASEYVYVSKIAVESAEIDPMSLYFQVRSIHEDYPGGSFEAISSSSSPLSLQSIPNCPSVAVLGRSNVGKSSLLNAIMKKQLAVTSKQPGRTQNVFRYGFSTEHNTSDTNDKQYHFCLVDLPGYGYAVGPDEAVDKWQKRTQTFLQRDFNLRRVYVLIDARHGANDMDSSILSWLDEAGLPYTTVLTKADATDKATIVKWTNQLCMRFHHQYQDYISEDGDDDEYMICQSPIVHVTSSKKNWGLNELMASITADMRTTDEDEDDIDQE